MNKKNLTDRMRATWTTSSSAKATTSATPLPTPENHLAAALQRAEQAEAQLRAMQNSRAWRTLQKLKKVLVRP